MSDCDDIYRLLLALCADEYEDLPPEFVPLAKKYGYKIAKTAQRFVENWLKSLRR